MKIKKVNNGIVLFLDALGVKGLNKTEAREFLVKFSEIYNELLELKNRQFKIGELVIKHRMPEVDVFQDTIRCTWDITGYGHDMPGSFYDACVFGALVVVKGIEKGVFFRGAISIGDFFYKKEKNFSSFVGPAISDAAAWHEQAEFIGLITTPSCDMRVPELIEKIESIKAQYADLLSGLKEYIDTPTSEDDFSILVRNDVHLKTRTLKLYSVSWPNILKSTHGESARRWLMEKLSSANFPKGTEDKYINTLGYFDRVIEETCQK